MKLTLKRSALVVTVLVLCALTVFAGNKTRVATAGAQELLIPTNARGIALAGANISSVQGVDALFFNPAGIARSAHSVEATFTTMNYIADIGVNYAAVTTKAGNIGTLGLSVKSLGFGDIPVTTELFPDGTGELYSPTYVNIGLSYSTMLNDRVSVGGTMTIINESIMSTSASGLAFDFGIQYQGLGLQGLNLGIVVKNVGGQMKYDGSNLVRPGTLNDAERNSFPNSYKINTTAFDLPTAIELGVSYRARLNEKNAVAVMGNFQNNNFSDDEYKVAAEYAFNDLVFVRGGYTLAADAQDDAAGNASYLYGFTAGVGVQLDLGGAVARLDYAYRSIEYFDGSNVFTISLGF